MNINPVSTSNVSPIELAPTTSPQAGVGTAPFVESFTELIRDADQQQKVVSQNVDALANGKADNLQQIAVDVAKAELSFRFVMELRDRLISSYQEMMRMQI